MDPIAVQIIIPSPFISNTPLFIPYDTMVKQPPISWEYLAGSSPAVSGSGWGRGRGLGARAGWGSEIPMKNGGLELGISAETMGKIMGKYGKLLDNYWKIWGNPWTKWRFIIAYAEKFIELNGGFSSKPFDCLSCKGSQLKPRLGKQNGMTIWSKIFWDNLVITQGMEPRV